MSPPTFLDGFILGIFATLLGTLANHLLAKDRDMRREFNDTANIFRNIFERIIATIHQNPGLTVCQIAEDILMKNYPDQSIAMGSLNRQMWCWRRCAFRKAWQKYIDPEDCGNEPFLSYCGMPYEEGKSFDRQYILGAIEHLISFSNK